MCTILMQRAFVDSVDFLIIISIFLLISLGKVNFKRDHSVETCFTQNIFNLGFVFIMRWPDKGVKTKRDRISSYLFFSTRAVCYIMTLLTHSGNPW